MPTHIKIVSITDIPEYRDTLVAYVTSHWPPVIEHFKNVLDACFDTDTPLPQCFVLLEEKTIIGFYQIIEHELITNQNLSPWLSCIFIDENKRGQRLSEKLTTHGRSIAGQLGYKKVYVTTDHIQFYEKFGFREIGIDTFTWGRPTKIYEHDTIK